MSALPTEETSAGTVEVTMPETGGSLGAEIVAWLKRPGEPVAAEEPLCLVAWGDEQAEITSPASGVLRMIALGTGRAAPTGTSLAMIDIGVRLPARVGESSQAPSVTEPPLDGGVFEPAPSDFSPIPTELEPEPAPGIDPEPEPEPVVETDLEPEPVEDGEPVAESLLRDAPVIAAQPADLGSFLSPAVLRFARESGQDPAERPGSGRGGRVTLRDLSERG